MYLFNKHIKRNAISVVELIFAMLILSLIVIGFLTGIGTHFSQLTKNKEFTKEIFEVKTDLEKASVMYRNANLSARELTSSNPSSKTSRLINELTKLNVDVNINKFTIFNNRATISGFNLKRAMVSRGTRTYNVFIPTGSASSQIDIKVNDVIGKLEYNFEFMSGQTTLKREIEVENPLFMYATNDHYFNANNYKKRAESLKYRLDAKYDKANAAKVLMTNYEWYASKKFGKNYEGVKNNKVFYPYFLNKTSGEPIGVSVPGQGDMYKLINKKAEFNTKEMLREKIADQYILGKAIPLNNRRGEGSASSSRLVWVIGLPNTKNLFYHFDAQFDGGWLEPGTSKKNIKNLMELSSVQNLHAFNKKNPRASRAYLSARVSGGISIHRNADFPYDKFARVSNGVAHAGFTYNQYISRYGGGSEGVTIFMIVRPRTDGTLLQRNKQSIYNGWNISYQSGNITTSKIGFNSLKSSCSRNKCHLITMRMDPRFAYLRIDNNKQVSMKHYGNLGRHGTLQIGGKGDFDFKEIAGYKVILSQAETDKLTEYFLDKYSNIIN